MLFLAIVLVKGAPILSDYERVVDFNVDVDKLGSDCINSPDIIINSLPWTIRLCKRSNAYTDYDEYGYNLDLYLESPFSRVTDWSCEAQAVIKLLPRVDGNFTPIQKNITKQEFHSSNSIYELKSFVKHDDLLEKYTTNNVATFEITLSTNPLKKKLTLSEKSSKFLMTIDQLKDFQSVSTTEIILRGMRWTVVAEKDDDYLSLHIEVNKEDINSDWGWDVTASFKLISTSKEKSQTRTVTHTFDLRSTRGGIPRFIPWSDLLYSENGFDQNDTVIFFVELSVGPPKLLWTL